MKPIKYFLTLLILFITPLSASAQRGAVNTSSAVAQNSSVMLENPLGNNINSVDGFISAVIDIVLYVAVPVLVLVFVWLGFKFIMAQGNAEELKKVKQNLWYTLLGAAIVLGASAISKLIVETFQSLK